MVLYAGFGAALALQSTHTSFDQRVSVRITRDHMVREDHKRPHGPWGSQETTGSVRITRDHRVLTLLVANVGMLQDKANIFDLFWGGGFGGGGGGTKKEFVEITAPNLAVHLTAAYICQCPDSSQTLLCYSDQLHNWLFSWLQVKNIRSIT